MDTSTVPTARGGYPPLMILAALAVILFCLLGTAAIMGWLPSSAGAKGSSPQLAEAERAVLAAGMPQPVQPDATPARAAPRKASKPVRAAEAGQSRGAWCADCGNVESTRTIAQRAQGSGIGAAGGAILGGLLGNQVGGGNGKQLATVAGAVGGAVVGNQVEGNIKASQTYEIRVRLDDGTLRTFHQSTPPDWRTGERVKIVKGRLRRA